MRVRALSSYEDDQGVFVPYGYEFDMPDGKDARALIAKGVLMRLDEPKGSPKAEDTGQG